MAALGLIQGTKDPLVLPDTLTAVALSGDGTRGTLPLSDVQFMHLSGYPGGGLEIEPVEVTGDPIHILVTDPKGWSTGMPAPRPATETNPPHYFMPVSDSRMAVLVPARTGADLRAFDVLDKATNAWRHVAVPFPFNLRRRSFGSWIAVISESSEFKLDKAGVLQPPTRISPGREKRATVTIGYKVTVDDMLSDVQAYFPGELWLYNIDSSKGFQISTGEGDSEILLVADGKVYYRVNDSIFTVDITASGLGPAVLLAKDPRLFQAHWAFLSNASPPATQ